MMWYLREKCKLCNRICPKFWEPFKCLLKQAGLPDIRFHDLRHSTATLLLSIGVHPKIVQETLGHSQIGITMNLYSHVMPTMQKEAMERLTALLQVGMWLTA